MGKGGGSSTASGYSTQSTQLPDWITGPAQQAVQQATALSQRPTQVNPYETVATPTADTQQAYQQIRNMQGAGDPNYAAATQGYLNLAPLAQGVTPGQLAANTQSLVNPQQLYQNTQALINPQQITANTQSLLDPYTDAVINPVVTQMRQGLAQNLQNIGKSASDVGAYGGSRQGVTEGVAQSQEAQNEAAMVANLKNQQWTNAAGQAMQLQQNAQQAALNQWATGSGQALDLSKLNLGTGLSALSQLPGVATAQQQYDAANAGILSAAGTAQQQQAQSQQDILASQWQEAQNYPVQNLDILLGALTGVPYGTTTSGWSPQQQPTSNVAGQVMGGISTAASVAGSIAAIV